MQEALVLSNCRAAHPFFNYADTNSRCVKAVALMRLGISEQVAHKYIKRGRDSYHLVSS